MSDHEAHGDPGDHGIHLPDPSMWPLIVGLASFMLGLALVWWSRDRHNALTGPFLGAAGVFTLIAAAGWAYEDGRMRKKAEEGTAKTRKAPRFTQVITFAVAEGQAAAAHAAGGVLDALNSSESLVKDLAGFQDYRVTVSPGTTGPLQVLAETTWYDREGLTSYDAAQQTLLDVINAHNDQIVPGSLQAFDMEVVRDTKETGFSLSRGAATALLGAFVVGGFMVGAGLNLFASDTVAVEGDGGGTTPPPATNPTAPVIDAKDNVFVQKEVTVAANSEITVTFNNLGKSPHNVTFFDKKGGSVIGGEANGNMATAGATVTFTFTSPGVGDYFYHCDFHPDQMQGTLHVVEAPAGGGAEGEGGAAAGTTTAS